MNMIIDYIRRKLSVRVSLWVVMFAAAIFIAALGFLFYQAREAVRKESINRATQILDNTSMRVSAILNRAEVATIMTEWLVMRHSDKADSMFVYSEGILRNNPDLDGCSIESISELSFRCRSTTRRWNVLSVKRLSITEFP